jgi:hypothetical protein
MIAPFLSLAITLQTVSRCLEQSTHSARTDGMSLTCQFVRQLRRAFARPAQRRLGISSRDRIDQLFQRGLQFVVRIRASLPPRSRCTQALGHRYRRFSRSRLQLPQSLANRVRRHSNRCSNGFNATPSIRPSFSGRPLSAHPLVHHGCERLKLFGNPPYDTRVLHSRRIQSTISKSGKLF